MSKEYFAASNMSLADMNRKTRDFYAGDKEAFDADPKYPKSLTPEERKEAAKNIKAGLKGKTGQKRAEARAQHMDPGPSDDTADASQTWKTKTPKNYESEERKAIQGESKSKSSTSFNFGANAKPKALGVKTPANYEKKERAAIQGEATSKGSTGFKFGANVAKPKKIS